MEAYRVYLVEDERIVAMDLMAMLRRIGCVVCGAASRAERALSEIPELRPDLVLMDIVLAGRMDGIEAAAELRENVGVPVVYVTANTDAPMRRRAEATAPAAFLPKPIDEAGLREALVGVLEQ